MYESSGSYIFISITSCKYVGAFMNSKDKIIAANIWDLTGSFSNASLFQKSSVVIL